MDRWPSDPDGCEYYHRNLSRENATRILSQNGEDGCFLIRDSQSHQGAFILCLLYRGKTYQYKILTDPHTKKLYVEAQVTTPTATSNRRKTDSLTELIEFYLTKPDSNGLKCKLTRGIRVDGEESDTDDEYSEVAPPEHLYSEPTESPPIEPVKSKPDLIRQHFNKRLYSLSRSNVPEDFTIRLKRYIEQDVAADALNKLSAPVDQAESFKRLKNFLSDEARELLTHMRKYLSKLELMKELFAKPGAPDTERLAVVETETEYRTLIGLLSTCKQELVNIEIQATESCNDLIGYVNVDAVSPKACHVDHDVPEAVFQVKSPKPLLGGMVNVTLTVNMKKGTLSILKDTTAPIDASNTISADKILQLIKSTKNTRALEMLLDGRRKELFYFDDIRLREHFCQLMQRLKNTHGPDSLISDRITVFVGTWNLGNESPPQIGLQPWLKSQGQGKTQVPSLASVPHDMYAIGTQEAKISDRDWEAKVKRILHDQFNIDFHQVAMCTMWYIRMAVFVKPEHKNRISNIQTGDVKTGIANRLGNKGAAAVSLLFEGTSMCFISSHLAANRERTARRNQNSRDILKNLSTSIGNKMYKDFDITNQFEHVFWCGDLNYRVDEEIRVVLKQAQEDNYPAMLEKDQLLKAINDKKAFFGFDEEVITFPPTYRYHKSAKNTYDWKKIKSSGEKINAPSWCDRVLWKSHPGANITNTSYGMVRDVTTSDHKPVFASFSLGVSPLAIGKNVNSPTIPITIILEKIKCELISEAGEKPMDFDMCIAGNCLEAPYDLVPATSKPDGQGSTAILWDDVVQLKPLFNDPVHLATQHILLVVKVRPEGDVMGDCVLSLGPIFNYQSEHDFECDLTNLGENTGKLTGTMKVEMKDVFNFKMPDISPRTSNIIYTDSKAYARPLQGLTWDEDDDDDEGYSNCEEMDRPLPRVNKRPMSMIAPKGRGHLPRRDVTYANPPLAGGEYMNSFARSGAQSKSAAKASPSVACPPRAGAHTSAVPKVAAQADPPSGHQYDAPLNMSRPSPPKKLEERKKSTSPSYYNVGVTTPPPPPRRPVQRSNSNEEHARPRPPLPRMHTVETDQPPKPKPAIREKTDLGPNPHMHPEQTVNEGPASTQH